MKSLMVKKLIASFLDAGYSRFEEEHEIRTLLWKPTEAGVYCICLIDDTNESLNFPGSVDLLIRQGRSVLEQYLAKEHCCVHGIIAVNSEDRKAGLLDGEETRWLADVKHGRLLIYENQPGYFLDARRCAENVLTGIVQNPVRKIPVVNLGIIFINVVLQVILALYGQDEYQAMYHFGAVKVAVFLFYSDWWRLLAAAFLHFSWQHMINNMLVLWFLGGIAERVLGKAAYLVLYFVSAVLANAASLVWYTKTAQVSVITAGASGAVFGVTGALLWVVIRSRGRLQGVAGWQLLLLSGFTLYHGISNGGVNNSAHIAGFLIGFMVSAILYRKQDALAE